MGPGLQDAGRAPGTGPTREDFSEEGSLAVRWRLCREQVPVAWATGRWELMALEQGSDSIQSAAPWAVDAHQQGPGDPWETQALGGRGGAWVLHKAAPPPALHKQTLRSSPEEAEGSGLLCAQKPASLPTAPAGKTQRISHARLPRPVGEGCAGSGLGRDLPESTEWATPS